MNCPEHIADILLQILQAGVVYARAAGWSNNVELATLEADHVHNLPEIIRKYDPEKLVYYWNLERPTYASRLQRQHGREPEAFLEYWGQLEPLMPAVRETLPATSAFHTEMQRIIDTVFAERGHE